MEFSKARNLKKKKKEYTLRDFPGRSVSSFLQATKALRVSRGIAVTFLRPRHYKRWGQPHSPAACTSRKDPVPILMHFPNFSKNDTPKSLSKYQDFHYSLCVLVSLYCIQGTVLHSNQPIILRGFEIILSSTRKKLSKKTQLIIYQRYLLKVCFSVSFPLFFTPFAKCISIPLVKKLTSRIMNLITAQKTVFLVN